MTQNGIDSVRDMYLEWTANRIKGTPSDLEAWGDVTAEPRGVDYIELDAAGLPAMWAVPRGSADDRVLLCIHGGGFVSGSIYTHRKLFAHVAKAVGARALLFDYRLAPEHVHPTQVDDATSVYRWLIEEHGIDPAHVALAGDSSGGGLAVTTQLRARERGLPRPAAALLMSPWVDMEQAGESYRTNWATETFFYKEVVDGLAATFLGPEGNPRDPLASPVHADLHGLAPLFIQVGGHETLLDESRTLAERALAAGVETQLEVFAGQQHTFQMAAGRAAEADRAIAMFATWLRPKLSLAPAAPAAAVPAMAAGA